MTPFHALVFHPISSSLLPSNTWPLDTSVDGSQGGVKGALPQLCSVLPDEWQPHVWEVPGPRPRQTQHSCSVTAARVPSKVPPSSHCDSSPTKPGLRAPTYSPNWAWSGGAHQFPGLEEPHIQKMLSGQVNEHWPLYLSVRDTQCRRASRYCSKRICLGSGLC